RPFVQEGKFAMEFEHVYRPQAGASGLQLINDDAVYRVEKVEPALIEGQQGRTVLAAGFVPIPVATTGPFAMRRLRGPDAMPTAATSGSNRLTGFLGNLFRGCR